MTGQRRWAMCRSGYSMLAFFLESPSAATQLYEDFTPEIGLTRRGASKRPLAGTDWYCDSCFRLVT